MPTGGPRALEFTVRGETSRESARVDGVERPHDPPVDRLGRKAKHRRTTPELAGCPSEKGGDAIRERATGADEPGYEAKLAQDGVALVTA